MKKLLLIAFLALSINAQNTFTQTLVSFYPLPNNNSMNFLWGLTQIGDTLWTGSDYTGKFYKITKLGVVLDSITTPVDFNHGLAWDGTGFWAAEDFRGNGARIYKFNLAGQKIDSILTGTYSQGIGGIALDGNNLWFASYYPDFTTYPFTYAYKMNLTTRTLTDSIPLRGKQVQGIAVKGDTIFYVTDNFQGDQERIYAYRKVVGDTLFSFAAPDPDNDCDPRGLLWDGNFLWLVANRIGNNINQYRNLYKYSISGQGSPQITANPTSINFGNVLINTTANQNLQISNTGTSKLIISSFTNTNPRFSIAPNVVPDTINIGQSKNYTVSFNPLVFDTTSGELRIASNDASQPVKVVTLRGKGVFTGAYIGISTNNFNYNTRRVNSLSGFTFNITNQGSQPLQINSVTFGSQRFRMDMTNVTFPVTIDTQKTRTFRIWFNPNSAISFSDSAVFNTNAVNNSLAKINLTGTGQNSVTALGDFMWEGNIPANPNTSSQDYQPKSLKEISDVNGDGINDIIVCTGNYWTICYNGNSSVTTDTLWKFNTNFGTNNTGDVDWEDAMQVINDIDGDGIQDVIIGCAGGNEEVYALSGKNGQKIWEYGDPVGNFNGDIYGLRTDKDFNGDGHNDIIISASGEGNGTGRHALICVNGMTGQELFNIPQSSDFTYDVTSTQSGGAIGTGYNGGPYSIKGFSNSGANTWTYPVTSATWNLRQVPDINNDNSTDIVGLVGFNGSVFALSGATGSQLWTASLGGSNNGTVEMLDDQDHNGYADLTVSGPQSAYRIDSKTGTILWTQSTASSYIRDAGMLGDVNGDSLSEVLISTQQPGKVFVLNGQDGSVLFTYSFGTSINERADRVAKLTSIDGNPSNEFVGICRDGRIKCFSGGPNAVIGISNNGGTIPKSFALYQGKVDVPKQSFVKISVFDILGRQVSELVNADMKPGSYSVDWNASNISSGVYFYKLETAQFSDVKKMIVVK